MLARVTDHMREGMLLCARWEATDLFLSLRTFSTVDRAIITKQAFFRARSICLAKTHFRQW